MNTDLVPINNELAKESDRIEQLQQLVHQAESSEDHHEAHALMQKGQLLADALRRMRAPAEETKLAAKACVLGGRKLGALLAEFSIEPRFRGQDGCAPSPRTEAAREVGLNRNTATRLVNLSKVPDPDFQRYIQGVDIPTITGALVHFSLHGRTSVPYRGGSARKKRAGVKVPPNPSLDAACTLIIKALGHLDGVRLSGGKPRNRAVGSAMNSLYEAEDLLKPYRGGYGK